MLIILEYKYFFGNLFGLVPLAVALFLAGKLRKTAILCGAILSLYSPLSWPSEQVYWTPKRLFGGGWGVEDVLFCFHTGTMSWLCALWPWAGRIETRFVATVVVRRLLWISLFSAILLAFLLAAGVTVMIIFTVTQMIVFIAITIRNPAYLRFAISGVPIFTAYYFLLLGLWSVLVPNFMGMWNGTELVKLDLLGVPVEEYLWVMSFCAGFSVTMAFCLDVQFKRR